MVTVVGGAVWGACRRPSVQECGEVPTFSAMPANAIVDRVDQWGWIRNIADGEHYTVPSTIEDLSALTDIHDGLKARGIGKAFNEQTA